MGAAAARATDGPVIDRLVDAVPDGIVIADESGVIRFANRALGDLVGEAATDLVGRRVETLVPDVHQQAHAEARMAYVGADGPANPMIGPETRLRTTDGRLIPVDVTVATSMHGDRRHLVVCLRDARPRRRLEAAVGGSERRLRELYEAVPLAILGLDTAGRVTYANPFLCALLGEESGDLVDEDGRAILHGGGPGLAEDHARLLGGATPIHGEARLTDANGLRRTLGWYTIPVHGDEGQVIGTLSIGEDLTDHRRSDAALRSVERLTRAVLEGRPMAEVEQLLCDGARVVADSVHAVVAAPGPHGCEVRAASGPASEAVVGRPASAPWCSSDADDAAVVVEGFPQLDPSGLGIGPAVMVPLSTPPNRGFLLVANAPGDPPFDDATIETLRGFAAQVTLALEYANRLRDLAVAEDRERIARDLHDLVIQRIFSAGLSLQIAAQLITDDPRVAERLTGVSEDLDAAIAELRRSILGLQDSGGRHLRRRIEALTSEVTDGRGLEVSLDVPDDAGPLPETLVRNLLAVFREALTNVVKHARAEQVEVTVEVGRSLVLRVRDDGTWLPPGADAPGLGLGNLSERARRLGGSLHVADTVGGGTLVEWRVPMLPPAHG